MTVPTHFATAVRAARLIRGFTLKEVAVGTGVPTARLAHIERGEFTPMPEEFARVWDFLASGRSQGASQ